MKAEVFGITGTNGKTTASYMLRNILKKAEKKTALIGTIKHQTGDSSFDAVNTTPGKDTLRKYFRCMEEEGTECCVMEISSHGIAQGRIAEIPVNYAGFTNLSRDHLDYHGDMENYFRVKRQLFLKCDKGAVINIDNDWGEKMFRSLKGEGALSIPQNMLKTCAFGRRDAYYTGGIMKRTTGNMLVSFAERGRVLGSFIVCRPDYCWAQNALLAASLARLSGLDFDVIRRGIEFSGYIPGRWEIVYENGYTRGIVDFAHTPDALKKLLSSLKKTCRGNLICVFGCGGERDRVKRGQMGRAAAELCDYTIITGDNPRSENPLDIIAEIEEGIYGITDKYAIIVNRGTAIKEAAAMSRKGDTVVVAGKGHEQYQIIGDEVIDFDDRILLEKYLKDKFG